MKAGSFYRRSKREYESDLSRYRVEAGLTVKEFCQIVGTPVNTYLKLNTGELSPLQEVGPEVGHPKKYVEIMAEVLGVDLSDLFPRYFCSLPDPLDELVVADRIHSGGGALQPDEALIKKEACQLAKSLIGKLTNKERYVLTCRFFGHTLEQVSSSIKVSRERARQLERRSLNRLTFFTNQLPTEQRELLKEALI